MGPKDLVYFTGAFTNSGTLPAQAVFKQTRSSELLSDSSLYYGYVERFSLSHTLVPILHFSDKVYSVNIGGKQTILEYVGYGDPIGDLIPGEQGVYTFSQFLESLNNALETSHNAAPASSGNPPEFVLQESGKFALLVDTSYTETINLSESIRVLFVSLPMTFLGFGLDETFSVIYGSKYLNTFDYASPLLGQYYLMSQENKSQFSWSGIRDIVITSSTLPVDGESVGTSSSTGNQTLRSITDFIPVQSVGEDFDRSPWIYNAGAGRRLFDMNSTSPLTTISYEVYLINFNGEVDPLYLAPGESVSVKFGFRKRSMENNKIM